MDLTRFEEDYKISNCPLFRHCSHGFVTWVVFNDLYVQGKLKKIMNKSCSEISL
jgi:hypothetical protein